MNMTLNVAWRNRGCFAFSRAPKIRRKKHLYSYSTLLLVLYRFVFSSNNGSILFVHAQLGTRGNSLCRIDDEPIHFLSYDAVKGMYVLLSKNTTMNETLFRRYDRGERHLRHVIQTSVIVANNSSKELISRKDASDLQIPENVEYIQMRECDCAGRFQTQNYSFFCPLNKHFCSVSRSSTPLCVDAPSASTYLAVNLKLFAVTTLTLLIVWLFLSPRGHDAIACCASNVCPCYFKEWYLNFLIKHRPNRVSKILRGWTEERQERLEARYRELQRLNGDIVPEDSVGVINGPLPPLDPFEESLVLEIYESRPSLVLKTRRYKKVSQDSSNATSSGIATVPSSDPAPPFIGNTTNKNAPDRVVFHGDHPDDYLVNSENGKGDLDDSSRNDCDRDDSCMICFATVLHGERVGVMPNCNHVFHSKCLKDWLKRRNVCPLCLDADVAVFSSTPKLKKSETQQSQQTDDG